MSFISFEFIAFFTIVAVVTFAAPERWRVWVVLAASVMFYALGGALYLPLLAVSTLVSYAAGLRIGQTADATTRCAWMALAALVNLGSLFVFKYFDFFAEALGAPTLNLALPLGISFYTFQCIAYPIDIYRGTIPPERKLGGFAVYIAFFPKLLAGPIERAENFLPQLRQPPGFDEARVVAGLRLILWGLFKKVVIADRLAIYVNAIYGDPISYPGLPLIVATVFFAFQIYCDFSGYSDIAVGLARVLGFNLRVNFRQPYLSSSVREFWRRWHISLSSWFRDYLYIPLGGSRVALWRMLVNLMIVFVVSGLWHGANWTFLVWGALHGAYVVVETVLSKLRPSPPDPLSYAGGERGERAWRAMTLQFGKILLTFVLVSFAWIFFRASSLDSALFVVNHLFDFVKGTENLMRPFREALLPQEIEFGLCVGLIALLLASDWIDSRWGVVESLGRRRGAIRWALYYTLALAVGVSLWLTATATQTFIYQQF